MPARLNLRRPTDCNYHASPLSVLVAHMAQNLLRGTRAIARFVGIPHRSMARYLLRGWYPAWRDGESGPWNADAVLLRRYTVALAQRTMVRRSTSERSLTVEFSTPPGGWGGVQPSPSVCSPVADKKREGKDEISGCGMPSAAGADRAEVAPGVEVEIPVLAGPGGAALLDRRGIRVKNGRRK